MQLSHRTEQLAGDACDSPSGLPTQNLPEGEKMKREMAFGCLIVLALIAFEIFNFSTTDFALTDLMGDVRFAGLRWATILAVAFCGIDFAGIARLFSPDSPILKRENYPASGRSGRRDPLEVWYLLGAWFLAAAMNAALTWWGVSLALVSHSALGNEILSREALLSGVPVFVAVLVWLIRILLIGTFSIAGNRLFSQFGATSDRSARGGGRPAPYPIQTARVIGKARRREPAGQSEGSGASFIPTPTSAPRPTTGSGRQGAGGVASLPSYRIPPAPEAPKGFRPAPKPHPAGPGGDSNGKLPSHQE